MSVKIGVFQNMTPCIWLGRYQIVLLPFTEFLGLINQTKRCHTSQEFNLTIQSLEWVKFCAFNQT